MRMISILLLVSANAFAGSTGGIDGTATAPATAAKIASTTPCAEMYVQNDPTSSTNIKIGYGSTPTIALAPGVILKMKVTNPSAIYVKAVSGTPTYNWNCAN